ncbi:hypothetical protein BDV93DRAFT_199474 [Ceratobasidium sp. AG-I]|nr:hypothetical protein BDV93DRAFT_199474 [Ceratobasidium sp. AG-I]
MILRTKSNKSNTNQRAAVAAAEGPQVVAPVVKPRRKRGRPRKVPAHPDTPPIAQLPVPIVQPALVDPPAAPPHPAPAVVNQLVPAVADQPAPAGAAEPAQAVIAHPTQAVAVHPAPPPTAQLQPSGQHVPMGSADDDDDGPETFNLDDSMASTAYNMSKMSLVFGDVVGMSLVQGT